MDIHENEEQLGETEPLSEEMQSEEETPDIEAASPETEETPELVVESGELIEPAEAEDVPPAEAEQTPEGELDLSDTNEDPQATREDEDSLETDDEVEDISQEIEVGLEENPEAEEILTEVEVSSEDDLLKTEEMETPEEVLPEESSQDPYAAVTLSEESVKEPDDGRVWYVVHCYSGNEDKVRHNIMQRIESMSMDDLIFDVVVPTEDEVNIKNGERQTVEKKVFPGYILVNMILTEESWYMVRNTPGVTGFVGMGNDPTPLQPEEVARILKRMESDSPRINVTFRPGERVRIVDGPFEDFYGKVSEIDMERATVRVMVNFFGRETPVELDFLQVEPA